MVRNINGFFKKKQEVRTYCLSFSALSSRTGASLQEGESGVIKEEGRGEQSPFGISEITRRGPRRTYLFVRPAMMASSEVVILMGRLAPLSINYCLI
jgi:hypothetical protein